MFKKILSYIYPFVVRQTSIHNGILRVILVDGKKILNTDHANYSFGSLHRIMWFALGKIELKSSEDILLLGLGAGSVIDIIRNDLHLMNKLVAVDLDPMIIEIARKEFGLDAYKNVEIVCMDAYHYSQEDQSQYGLIVIDLFIDNRVPEQFYDEVFWGNISRILSSSGQIIFNTMIKDNSRELFDGLIKNMEERSFSVSIHDKVDRTNIMMIMKRK